MILDKRDILWYDIRVVKIIRRDGRVVEGAALEMLCGGNFTVGSNPTLSAIFFAKMRDSLNEMKAIPEKHFWKAKKMAEWSRQALLHGTQCRFMHRRMRFIFCGIAAKCFIKNAWRWSNFVMKHFPFHSKYEACASLIWCENESFLPAGVRMVFYCASLKGWQAALIYSFYNAATLEGDHLMAESKLRIRLFVIFLANFYRLNFAQSVLRRIRSSRFLGMLIICLPLRRRHRLLPHTQLLYGIRRKTM